MKAYDLILVMPAYNEEGAINKVVTGWHNYLSNLLKTEQWKMIVVNDGSSDQTGALLDQLAIDFSELEVVHQENQGHGNSVLNAYELALQEEVNYVFQTDSDWQFVPDDFLSFWKKRKESPFILGNRVNRHDPIIRLMVTLILRWIIALRFGKLIPDSNIPYRLMKADYLRDLLGRMPHKRPFAPNIFLSVLAAKKGAKLMHLPVKHLARETGEVSIKKWKLMKVLLRSWGELLVFRT